MSSYGQQRTAFTDGGFGVGSSLDAAFEVSTRFRRQSMSWIVMCKHWLGCLLLLGTFPCVALAQFTFVTNADKTLTVTGYKGSGGAVDIPETINGLPVTSIGDFAFVNSTNLTSITMSNSVTSIGNWTFDGCYNLTSITLSDNVTNIGNYAFGRCTNLTSISIPSGVTVVMDSTFCYCYSLTSVTIPNTY